MKLNLLFLFLLVFSAIASAADYQVCRDNCGEFVGGCEACHQMSGPNISDIYEPVCNGCSHFKAAKPTDTLVAFIQKLTPSRDHKPRYIDPALHARLMQRALASRRDGPMLGTCATAFKQGTLSRLPAEIKLNLDNTRLWASR